MKALLAKEEFSLDDVLRIADRMNPELAAERKNIDLATAAVWEARLYPNPSLIVEVEDYRTRDARTIGLAKRTAGVSLPLVVSGRIGAAADAAETEREIASIRYVWRRREILAGVKRAFLELLAARRSVELARETRDVARRLDDATNERFRAQTVPEMEVLKSAVNLAKAEIDLKTAEKVRTVGIKTLHALLGNADFPNENFSGDLPVRFTTPSLEALRGQVIAFHPLIEAAQLEKEAAERRLDLARAERIPDLQFQVAAGRDGEDETIAQAGFEIPIPLFNRNQAKIASAEARIRQAAYEIESERNSLILRLTGAHAEFVAAQERVMVYRDEILPKAQQALDQTDEGYRQGKFGYLDVLDAQRTLSEAKIAYTATLTDLNLAAAELEKLTGMRLDPVR